MRLAAVSTAIFVLASLASAQLTVTAVSPPLNASNAAPNTAIVVDFDRAVAAASLGAVDVYGNSSGAIAGALALSNGDARLTFTPLKPYFAGELVTLSMSHDLQAQDTSFLRAQGYVASFRVTAAAATRAFTLKATWDVSTGSFARVYGAQSCDLDEDGFSDLAVVCEVASDVRVYLHLHDGTGSYGPLVGSPNDVGDVPSPNENGDLNGDGNIDIVTSESGSSSVSVLLGNGDGTFQASTTYPVGQPSHGLALFEADGDGDVDIAATANDQVHLLRNNGNGTFAAAVAINTAVSSDYGLTAADMDEDGIVDLVVGGTGGDVMVLRSNGNGTFTPKPTQDGGGFAWMIVAGDVNEDGHVDVSIANGTFSRGSIVLGNGDGTLQPAVSTPGVGHMPATDLGDLDGDGDLDWILSSYGANLYQFYVNDGAGHFTFDQSIPGIQNPACCTIFDLDGDRDLDVVLFDETTDILRTFENSAADLDQTTYCYGTASACPCGNAGDNGHGCENSVGSGGALLLAQGEASVSSDSLALNVGGVPGNVQLVFIQSASQAGGGLGIPFGDGLLCVGSPIKRLKVKNAQNGFATLGPIAGDAPISQLGLIPPAGGTFRYQAWYRNPVSFCTSDFYNLSNGLRIVWLP